MLTPQDIARQLEELHSERKRNEAQEAPTEGVSTKDTYARFFAQMTDPNTAESMELMEALLRLPQATQAIAYLTQETRSYVKGWIGNGEEFPIIKEEIDRIDKDR